MSEKQIVLNPFKGGASLVLRFLLSDVTREWAGREIAAQLKVSQSWVNTILATLEAYRLVERHQKGRDSLTKVIAPTDMLARWSSQYNIHLNGFYLYLDMTKNPLKRIKEVCEMEGHSYALTGYIAANKISKTIYGDVPPMVYLWPQSGEAKDFQKVLNRFENIHQFIPVKKQANLILLKPFQGEKVFFGSGVIKGFPVVSPLQLYLDLADLDRGKFVISELADFWKKKGMSYVL